MNVQRFLKQRRTWYETIQHDPTYDANALAQAVHVIDQEVAKPVLLRVDDGYALIVLPASRDVDVSRVKSVFGAASVTLASEPDCGHEFLDCEYGARLPFGSEYGLRTVMDVSLCEDDEIVFEGNTHREAIRMKLEDYIQLEQPFIAPVSMPHYFAR